MLKSGYDRRVHYCAGTIHIQMTDWLPSQRYNNLGRKAFIPISQMKAELYIWNEENENIS